jgi:transposase InsO family protein
MLSSKIRGNSVKYIDMGNGLLFIKKYDELFNNHRPHMGLKGLTPLQKLQSYAKYKSVTYVYV